MTVHQIGKSAAIRIECPPFKVEDGIEIGVQRTRVAFEAIKRLIEFYRKHGVQLDAAAAAAMPL
jgi:hypothetical protein